MEITKEDVKHVAHLSKLAFDETETAEFAGSLTKIVDMFLKLEEVDTTGVPFTSNVADNINTWREDVAVSGWNRDELFKNVPETEDGFIKVPTIMEDN
ncbi:MAG: Asp-tRNA(Asn)/Glu-tRNA(Gln) amidotransferase subunit GatC [Lactococcus sp.]|jgi:aspartyl-tRNA(Asn)/glutamyl-tRNA(Gln) amidotransferase subunit C|uniref:Aspartyl/glutamyl-tRNA(Asn/Gln) amidotransferase subunit C n=4 Tax=Pseudolactococcus TaxID=3436058 RepID=A0A7L4WDZ4_9LACT|nr:MULTISPECIES: Asp-tRNA(Asn)/Glu-tRNA(Gln) amidotransferase subunit GatC [Lactococcus]MCJ1969017.1 Asp-tRNA(Asn)/Glu-tRNA(Gln) amidotransferase subunit GatC [Lactococcus carnosus]MCJ1973077.1 Asp-tRNA(Asn)/Glu-tRNA(Gln) amidotransferase subunit GatC [Lactococcus carnosus]MCJ1975549.1 Asp-tRNA(Asn)/Glu-tRNA(Gln) amidotransferase subunit GatC [Lactococcus carnosus]MCJ1978271.1 Asp-tRNA(Asn)/Glu-tRNA(Gln) amidotransferase subunit GatC [Lactococcus paracarnosus]MCJ1979364.1 Asp-tRNA(Asn)/Glu-tRN